MSQTQLSIGDRPVVSKPRVMKAARYFFPGVAVIFLVVAFIGFSQFYLHGKAYPGREIPPPIKALVIAHGLSMTAWLVLLVLQPTLISLRRHKLHMKIGRIGVVLAALILVTGVWLAIASARQSPPDFLNFGLLPGPFMAIPFLSVLVFTAFVALAVAYRRRPHLHRTMMILGTLFTLSAATARIDVLNNLYLGTVWEQWFGPFFMAMALGVLLLAVRSVLLRSFDHVLAIGMLVLVLLSALVMRIATTPAWEWFANLFIA